ncbi:MAG TPA: hypothetical protein VM032_00375 [Vicinamibacterales bacterium]|nr:hypothetical protein [Vicinamibacterales bacterium]
MRSRVPAPARIPSRLVAHAVAAVLCLAAGATPRAQTDLDTFMQQVLAERDTNWKKLQQYILDEREQFDMRGPSAAPLWGERRDYTWYVRDRFFIRSPLKVNGAAVGEADRLKYEHEFLEREKRREARAQASAPGAPERGPAAPGDVDGLIRQSRQPQFISSAYFLRFRFDAGRYALVGREALEGREVLRIEYYPERLFTPDGRKERVEELGTDDRSRRDRGNEQSKSVDREMMRLMNKASKVTLWIEPVSHQILKYTFDDLGWNFFPGQWLAQMDGVTASMTMGQPFPEVWLPRGLEMHIRMQLAFGGVELRYTLQYDNYRQPDVRSRVIVPDRP